MLEKEERKREGKREKTDMKRAIEEKEEWREGK